MITATELNQIAMDARVTARIEQKNSVERLMKATAKQRQLSLEFYADEFYPETIDFIGECGCAIKEVRDFNKKLTCLVINWENPR